MFSPTQSSHRPRLITRAAAALPDLHHHSSNGHTTLIARVTRALPDVPHPHKKHRHAGAAAIMRAVAGLVGVLIGTGAVIFRNKLASLVSRGKRGEEHASEAAKE
jgi:hypothetical protein